MKQPRETRHWARRISLLAVLLLAGAAANVAVAWLCVIKARRTQAPDFVYRHSTGGPPADEAAEPWVAVHLKAHPGQYFLRLFDKRGFGVVERSGWLTDSSGSTSACGPLVRAGWPAKSLRCWIENDYYLPRQWVSGLDRSDSDRGTIRRLSTARLAASPALALPLRPELPGFAINSAFYAAALAALVFGPGAARRRHRRRTGRCIACGYEVKDLTICPECGGSTLANYARRTGSVEV